MSRSQATEWVNTAASPPGLETPGDTAVARAAVKAAVARLPGESVPTHDHQHHLVTLHQRAPGEANASGTITLHKSRGSSDFCIHNLWGSAQRGFLQIVLSFSTTPPTIYSCPHPFSGCLLLRSCAPLLDGSHSATRWRQTS